MVAGVYDGQDVTLYVDDDGAVASGSIATDRSTATGETNLFINARSLDGGGPLNHFNGFNQYSILIPSALTEEQISEIYKAASTGEFPNGDTGQFLKATNQWLVSQ